MELNQQVSQDTKNLTTAHKGEAKTQGTWGELILERALERGQAVPVVPMALRGMWSSMWSHRDGRLGRMRVPRRFRAHVEVAADAPTDPRAATAESLEATVRELRGGAA